MTQHDDDHLDAAEAQHAASPVIGTGTPATAPHESPPPALAEPVAVGAGLGVIATVTTLIASGVPWYGALGLAVVLVLVAAWQRQQVTPYR